MNITDLVTQSCQELRKATLGQPLQAELLAAGVQRLNMVLDHFNANDRALFAELFSQYAITPNLQPHTIGPVGATWIYATARPKDIPAASLILTSTSAPYPFIALRKLTAEQWQSLSVPALASSVASYYYYDPTFPNGSFYFWTKETTAYSVQLQTRQPLAQVTPATTFAEPPGYWEVLMRMTAKQLAPMLGAVWTPMQEDLLRVALIDAFGDNGADNLLETRDVGIPQSGQSGSKQDFNYLNGQIV